MASKIIAYCQDCGFQKENNFNYCPSSGKEVSIDDERQNKNLVLSNELIKVE